MAHVVKGVVKGAVEGVAKGAVKPIASILVANRGEIARRIMRTARELGIKTIAVYADGDAGAPFVREADLAIALHGRTSAETYLDSDKLLAACRKTGADALHPGYGFLSENAAFAQAVADAGLAWIGPSPEVIGAMGDKLSAKKLMQEAGVPTLPA
ncbi:MAG: biotin carboxylase N-terminal domain-containing protein, partial [Pseudomonadales bacterium]